MNAPNFNFDAEGRSDRLPSTMAHGSHSATHYGPHSITHASRESFSNFDAVEEQASPNLRKLFFMCLGLALKYRWLILAICAFALTIGFIVTFTSTPIYQATATIQIDLEAPKVVKLDAPEGRQSYDSSRFYQTQYDLLKSRSLAERVAKDLDLGATSDFLNPQPTSAWGKLRSLIFSSAHTPTEDKRNLGQRNNAAAGMVQAGVSVGPVPRSSLVKISFNSPSPTWAQRIANGVADSYISLNLERRYGATSYARTFLKERLEELKLKLEESEKALVAYADEKELIGGISAGDTKEAKQSLFDSDLVALNSALQKVVAERIRAQESWEQANASTGIGLPQILEDKAIGTLTQQRAALMADYQNKLSIFKAAYPDMVRLKAQIDQISQEIKSA